MRIYVFLLIAILYSCFSFAAQEVSFKNIWINPKKHLKKEMKPLDVSVYISQQSEWTEDEIISRLKEADLSLNTCGYYLNLVFFFNWNFTNQLLRVDEYIDDQIFYDGMRFASEKSVKITPIQLFYFQNYSTPFTAGPSIPLAIYPNSDLYEITFNTAWFPYQSAQRLRQEKNHDAFVFNEEAHEIGHILLKDGHDHSGKANIMAHNSNLRHASFLGSQCKNIKIPKNYEVKDSKAFKLFPFIKLFFVNYSRDFYMSDWCSRNVSNFYEMVIKFYPEFAEKLKITYALHRNRGESFYPLNSRRKGVGWKFHAFLSIEDWVIDFDFTNQAQIISTEEYMREMFGFEQVKDLYFVHNNSNEQVGFSYLDILEFAEKSGKKWTYQELID